MTETPDQRRLSGIARSLNRYEWSPTLEEIECGADFFKRAKTIEVAENPGFPRGPEPEPWKPRLHTENVAVLAQEVGMVQDELLPKWRARFPVGSTMVELIEMYIRGAQPIVQHADAVLTAWREAALPEPSDDELAYRTRYSGLSVEEARARLRYQIAAGWEEDPSRRALWEEMLPAWTRLGAVRSTMMAAVTGDVEY
ncbi:hypothetical protein QQY66_34385 [Streptomyces sp. DG2A-72]|uniref:hypothetical protein n=1 Tax=Streptomyces sp. DG2A-72 TaxID=3051386 RepID=UPI00265C45CC|nr:hypothetical protein [Streptomyces sp. DG2A-72]MDO0936550.1 hypothetical protein [Streptomyces sp. DG2A-72]